MKKRWCVFLMALLTALMLVCGGCGQSAEPGEEQPAEPDPAVTEVPEVLEEALAQVEEMEVPVREYGESYGFNQLDGILLTHILYPVSDLEPLNGAIEAWIDEQMAYYEEDAKDYVTDERKAELTVEYESRLIEDHLVSVRMTGIYDAPFMAHPVDIVKTFNASLKTGQLAELSDVLEDGGAEILLEMVTEDGGVNADQVDDGMLNHWYLTPEGLEITLARGDYLAMSEGTKVLTYSYGELEGILNLDKISVAEDITVPETSEGQEPDDVPDVQLPEADLPDPDKPMLALTFDDGPSAHTDRLLDAFAEHGGKGTFFVVGNLVGDRPETMVRMAAEGHEIAGHSWNHRQLTTLGGEDLQKQLLNTRAKIYDITGVDAILMRPPYGSFNDDVKAACREYGIAMVNWSVDTLDWKYRDANTVYQSVMNQAKDGAIILCHDLHGTTVDAMERAIPDLIAEGYQLVTVSQLLTSQGGEIEAGKVYYNR